MGNIYTLIENLESVPDKSLLRHESQIKEIILETRDAKAYRIFSERTGASIDTELEIELLERAQAEDTYEMLEYFPETRNQETLPKKVDNINSRIRDNAKNILHSPPTDERNMRSLVSRIYGPKIKGRRIGEIYFGELAVLSRYIVKKARKLSEA